MSKERTPEITDDLIDPICQLADLGLSEVDTLLNRLILAARDVKEREGFFVVEGKLEEWS